MTPENLFNQFQELLNAGQLEDAQQFLQEHAAELGDYLGNATEMLNNFDVSGLTDQVQNFSEDAASKVTDSLEGLKDNLDPSSWLEKIMTIFKG